MRVINPHRHDAPASTSIPDAKTVYEAALTWLHCAHEREAADCLFGCTLDVVPAEGTYPQREELQPVRLILSGHGHTMSVLEHSPEIRGKVRQALDNALGPTVYLTQMSLSTCVSALAA